MHSYAYLCAFIFTCKSFNGLKYTGLWYSICGLGETERRFLRAGQQIARLCLFTALLLSCLCVYDALMSRTQVDGI